MMPSLFNNTPEDDYLDEFKQKIAAQKAADFEERRLALQRSRNGFIGTLAGIALAGVVGWLVLAPKFATQNTGEVPVIHRPVTPAKIQPTEPGGMEIPDQDKSVYQLVEKKSGDAVKAESLLPQPETPQMPTIVPEEAEETTALAEEPADDVSQDPNKDLLQVKPMQEKIESVTSTNGQKINIPEKPQEISSTVKTAEKATPQKAVQESASKTVTASTPAAKGVWQVQLVASANKDAVEKAWAQQVKKYAFLNRLSHEVESLAGANGTMYRLKAGAFKNRQGADEICAKIKAAGGSCVVKQK